LVAQLTEKEKTLPKKKKKSSTQLSIDQLKKREKTLQKKIIYLTLGRSTHREGENPSKKK
jgi:hypothetical protein